MREKGGIFMEIFLIIAAILVCLILGYVIWQYFELKRFEVTKYQITTDKLQKEVRLVVLADLHGFEYGKRNQKLIKQIQENRPDLILIAGDMIVSKYPETYGIALKTLMQLVAIAPVYYSFGNHESRAAREGLAVYGQFQDYKQKAEALGVHFLQNENMELNIEENKIYLGGIEIALDYYEKGHAVFMEQEYIGQLMGTKAHNKTEGYQILLAHNPAYSEQYAAWGADLTFCGHNHGGLVRIPGIGSLISPQFTLFPKYNDGMYEIGSRRIIVSRGLGTHTFHVRVWNRAELISVRLVPFALEKSSIS